jgi:hypothetical protein
VHTTVHIQNRVMLRNNTNKTPYELWKGRPANVNHFKVFGSKCYIKREDCGMGKFDSHVEKGLLVGYSSIRKLQVLQSKIEQIFGKHQRNN